MKVYEPSLKELLNEDGLNPDQLWLPPGVERAGEVSLNEYVGFCRDAGRAGLGSWLPDLKGSEAGVTAVQMVNEFVDELFPLLSEDGAEWEYSLSYDQKVLHDLLSESIEWPEEASYDEQVAFVQGLLDEYRESSERG